MKERDADVRLHLWRFVRGDEPAEEFERWARREPELEERLGHGPCREVLSTDFRDLGAVEELRDRLAPHARALPGPRCLCARLRDRDVVDPECFLPDNPAFEVGRWSHDDVFAPLERVRTRGEPFGWLWAARCSTCGQGWLVGSEERHNQVSCLRRLEAAELSAIEDEGRWPTDFDRYEDLLRLALERGHQVGFLDPLDPTLRDTVIALARERPGIALSELEELLNLYREQAVELARRATSQAGVEIAFDGE